MTVKKVKKTMGRPRAVPTTETPAARLRAAKGWSLVEMAAEFGVSDSTVSRWERGVMEPSGPAKKLIAQYLENALLV